MKKMTKLFSGILAAAMLASVVPASAAMNEAGTFVSTDKKYIPNGWEVIYNEGKNNKLTNTDAYLRWTWDEIENNYAATWTAEEDLVGINGNTALLLSKRDWEKDDTSNRTMELRGSLKETIGEGTYRLSLWYAQGTMPKTSSIHQTAKPYGTGDMTGLYYQLGTVTNGKFSGVGSANKVNGKMYEYTDDMHKPNTEGDLVKWRLKTTGNLSADKQSYDIVLSSGQTANAIHFTEGKNENILLDNICLQKVTTDEDGNEVLGENLVVNGDFESGSSINVKNYEPTELYSSNTWTINRQENKSTTLSEDWAARNYAGVTAEVGRGGGSSLFVHFEDASAADTFVNVYNNATQNVKLTSGVTYVQEMWVKGHFDYELLAYPMWINCDKKRVSLWTRGETDSEGWTKYSAEFKFDGNKDATYFAIGANQYTNLYIDDVKLYNKTTPDTNLITDGGFENNKVIDTKSLINPIAYSVKGGSAATLSWTNPENSKITDIKVKLDGTEVSGLTINKASGAYNCVLLRGLTDYNVYTVTLEEYINGSLAYTKELKFYTNDRNPREVIQKTAPMGGWILDKTDNNGNYQNSNASLDYETYNEGKSSLRFDANMPEVKNNLYVAAEQKLTGLSRGNHYKLSFYAKTSGVSNLIVNENASYTKDDTKYSYWGGGIIKENAGEPAPEWKLFEVVLPTEKTGDNGWKMYETGATDTYDVTLQILSTKMTGTLWIDGVKLVAVDNDDDPIDDVNLITNGGFEFDGKYVAERPDFKDKNGSNLETLKGFSGDVKVTAAIKNIAAGNDFKAAIIIGLYKNSELVSCTFMDKGILPTAENLPSDRFSATVNVPEVEEGTDDTYAIKVMYWKGIGSMEPLTTGVTLK